MPDSTNATSAVSDTEPTLASTIAANASLLAELEELQAALTAAQRVATRASQIRPVPLYPDTRYAVLCTLEGRKSGRVTVGESRLPAATVLDAIHTVGVEEARLMWPQLGEELGVLAQLATDLATKEAGDDE